MKKVKLTRIQYRKFKSMNHSQMEEFVANMYNEAYEEGKRAAEHGIKLSDIAVAIMEVRGIDTQKAEEIMNEVNKLCTYKEHIK